MSHTAMHHSKLSLKAGAISFSHRRKQWFGEMNEYVQVHAITERGNVTTVLETLRQTYWHQA